MSGDDTFKNKAKLSILEEWFKKHDMPVHARKMREHINDLEKEEK